MLILIDNFDSFTYNIVHAFQMLDIPVKVVRHNACRAETIFQMKPSHLVIGPGPGNPQGAGISKQCIELACEHSIPLLGICLGHQAIGEVFGGDVKRAKRVMHGKTDAIYHDGKHLFKGLPQGFQATRYHSLIVDGLPPSLELSAWTKENEIMALSHTKKPLFGVQFHPESIASEHGLKILENFLGV